MDSVTWPSVLHIGPLVMMVEFDAFDVARM